MSNPANETGSGPGADQMMSAMFASMVMQNSNMALIFLDSLPNPQTGQTGQDLEHARYFIDLLEMLAVKTKGNLEKQEEALLKQSLTHLRFAFVEAVQHPPKPAPSTATPPPAPESSAIPVTPPGAPPPSPPTDEQETPIVEPALPGEEPASSEQRKKFSKTY